MNTCAQCRFWSIRLPAAGENYDWDQMAGTQSGDFEDHGLCKLTVTNDRQPMAADSRAIAVDYEGFSAKLLTRSDFGCVQFEHKPMPETMPVIYVGEGEYVEPIPGHRFGPIYFKRAQPIGSGPVPDFVAHKIAIDDQWFEIRPRP